MAFLLAEEIRKETDHYFAFWGVFCGNYEVKIEAGMLLGADEMGPLLHY